MAELKLCPFCGGKNHTTISASGGEFVCLNIYGYGSHNLNVCLDCGLVYVDKVVLDQLAKRRKQDGTKKN